MVINLCKEDIEKAIDLWLANHTKGLKRISGVHEMDDLSSEVEDLYIQVDYMKQSDLIIGADNEPNF